VAVEYPAVTYTTFHLLLNGQIFTQHQGGSMYSYLRFGDPDFKQGERRVLYVDLMPLKGYPHEWRFDGLQYRLYLFSYLETARAEVDLNAAPMVTPEQVMEANRTFFPEYAK